MACSEQSGKCIIVGDIFILPLMYNVTVIPFRFESKYLLASDWEFWVFKMIYYTSSLGRISVSESGSM